MEKIDFNKLNQREIIILTHNRVVDLEKKVEKISDAQVTGRVEMAVVKTRVKQWGGIWGVVGGSIIAGIISLIKLTQ